jgi:hypothetical protein
MTRKHLRNALTLAFAAISASLEAPRLTHEPLATAAASMLDANSAIDDAVETVASNVSGTYPGFDTNIYPGDKAMDAWKRSGEYKWVGYYLQGACHKDGSWMGTRDRLVDAGWGLAVIYVGQQTWGRSFTKATTAKAVKPSPSKKSKKSKAKSARRMARKSAAPVATTGAGCSASYVNAAQGVIDARDAIARTAREGFSEGTVVFLDVEHMDVVPQRMRDYYRSWTRTMLADGRYRPGIYAHTANAATIYDDVSDAYAQANVAGDPPFWVAGAKGFSTESAPTDVGHSFASAWQGVLDVVRTHNGVRLPIDISVASVASPSSAAVQ